MLRSFCTGLSLAMSLWTLSMRLTEKKGVTTARLTALSSRCWPIILGELGNSISFGQGVNLPTQSSAVNRSPLQEKHSYDYLKKVFFYF
jgi:hypothetical protein